MACPKCKSQKAKRIKRRFFEKYLFLGKKKYKCYDCKHKFFS